MVVGQSNREANASQNTIMGANTVDTGVRGTGDGATRSTIPDNNGSTLKRPSKDTRMDNNNSAVQNLNTFTVPSDALPMQVYEQTG